MPRIPNDLDVGLIIVSPMKRTIETALLAFGDLIERGIPIVAHAGWQGMYSSLMPIDFLHVINSILNFPISKHPQPNGQ